MYARRRTDRDWMLQHGSSSLLRSPERSQALAPTNASNIFHGGSRWWQSRGREPRTQHPRTAGYVRCRVCIDLQPTTRTEFSLSVALKPRRRDPYSVVFFRWYIINAPPSTPSRVFCVWMRLWERLGHCTLLRFYMRVDCFRAVGKGEVNFSR